MNPPAIDRRSFLKSTAMTGAGLTLAPAVFANTASESKPEPINVAVIGLGAQGLQLVMGSLRTSRIGGTDRVRFKAVCDIWPFRRDLSKARMKHYGLEVNAYADYKEMLAKEKDLDAVIIATPDWTHAEMSIAFLKAGVNVYCESPMAGNLTDAAKMVAAAKASGKRLQIGHHRRSDPRYIAAEEVIRKYRLLGKIKNVNAQCNRCVRSQHFGLPKNEKMQIAESTVKQYGYESIEEFVNWRLYDKYSVGPLADRGAGQIDAVGWFLGGIDPKSVLAMGGSDYFKGEHDDNVMSIYEYQGNDGSVRAFHQVLSTTMYGAYGKNYEVFMGDEASLVISAFSDRHRGKGWLLREGHMGYEENTMQKWQQCQEEGLIGGRDAKAHELDSGSVLGIALSDSCEFYYHPLLTGLNGSRYAPHLENFFDCSRGSKKKLNCPAEEGYRTAVAVIKARQAVKGDGMVRFDKDDFKV